MNYLPSFDELKKRDAQLDFSSLDLKPFSPSEDV